MTITIPAPLVARTKTLELPDALVTSIRDQRAILFLGVGASIEGRDTAGKATPSVNVLRDELSRKFQGRVHDSYSLMDLAERLIVMHGEPAVMGFIRDTLDPYQPGPGHLLMPGFRWRAIATTNYDLLIERAYKADKDRLQNLVPFIKDTDQVDDGMQQTPNGVEFLKLHGCIADSAIPLILSNEHYEQHLDNRKRLFNRLEDFAQECPIVFCGYSLADPHIRSLLYRMKPENRPMFYIVAPDKTDMDIALFGRLKTQIIDATFTDFMKAVDEAIPKTSRVLRVSASVLDRPIRKHYRTNATESATLLNFLERDATYVYPGMEFAPQSPQDFYKGIDTGWGAIAQSFDVDRKVVSDLLNQILNKASESKKRPDFYVLKGPAGNGKTVALKRVAWEISSHLDELVLWIDESAALDPAAIGELYNLTGKTIHICIDRVAGHVLKLKKLADYATKNSIPLVIISTETDADWYAYCTPLDCLKPTEMEVRYLSPAEINQLIDLLGKHKALGMLDGKPRDEQFRAFSDGAERQLLVALHEATLAEPFEDIVFEEYCDIVPEETKTLYLDICTLNQFSVPVRAGTVSRVSGIPFSRYADEIFGPLKNIVMTVNDRYTGDLQFKARHSRVAKLVFQRACETSAQKADQLVRLVQHLDIGYSVDREAVEKLSKGQMLIRTLDVEDGRRVYTEALQAVGRQAFLLQQSAIFESNHPDGSLKKAQQYGDEARSIEPRSNSIMHTQAEIARKRAKAEDSSVLKDQYRRLSRERLGDMSSPNDRLVFSTKMKLLIDELEEVHTGGGAAGENTVNLLRECEALINQGKQQYPDEPEFHDTEARLRQILAQTDAYVVALERSVAAGSTKDGTGIRLSKAYRARGKDSSAYKTLDETLAKSPDSKVAHFAYAKMLLEDKSSEAKMIEGHLARSYQKGDSNHEARHLHAQYLFVTGEQGRAMEIFRQIHESAPPEFLNKLPRKHSLVSATQPKGRGRIEGKNETFLFISVPGSAERVFAHEKNTSAEDWDALRVADDVEFDLYFYRRGPIAAAVKVIP